MFRLVFHQFYTSTLLSFIVLILFPVNCILCIWQYFTCLSVLLDNNWICGTWRPNVKPSEIFKVDQKGWNAHNLYTNSLSFWPICQRRSTDIPTTINGQRAAISTKTSADSQSLCRPSLSRYTGWYIGWYVDQHIPVDISTDTWPICRPTYRPTLGRYVDRHIGRVSANMLTEMSTDISVEGCTKYTWSG